MNAGRNREGLQAFGTGGIVDSGIARLKITRAKKYAHGGEVNAVGIGGLSREGNADPNIKLGTPYSGWSAENDPFLQRHLAQPQEPIDYSEASKNYMKGYASGWVGLPGAFAQMFTGENIPSFRGGMKRPIPFPTEGDVGNMLNADVESDAFRAGTIGIPSIDDALMALPLLVKTGRGIGALSRGADEGSSVIDASSDVASALADRRRLREGIASLDVPTPTRLGAEALPASASQAPQQLIDVGGKPLSRFFTEAEIAKLKNTGSAASFMALTKAIPEAREMATVAQAGMAKRGWYQASAHALSNVFGQDAPRFAGVLASTSPQVSVQSNLLNASNIFKNWNAAGRPSDPRLFDIINEPGVAGALMMKKSEGGKMVRILEAEARSIFKAAGGDDGLFDVGRMQLQILGESVQGSKGIDSVMDAWVGNTIRSLNVPENKMGSLVLSGPKVDSFMRNLVGNTIEVTNDTWIANYLGIPQTAFAGSLNPARIDPGKGPGYIAANVLTRKAADILSNRLGERVTGPEVQEMVWSWSKSVFERARSEGMSPVDFIKQGRLTNAMINDTPDFSRLLNDPDLPYRNILKDEFNIVDPLPGRVLEGNVTQEIMSSSDALRRDLQRAANRLQRIKGDQVALAAVTPLIVLSMTQQGKENQEPEELFDGGAVSVKKYQGGGPIDDIDIFQAPLDSGIKLRFSNRPSFNPETALGTPDPAFNKGLMGFIEQDPVAAAKGLGIAPFTVAPDLVGMLQAGGNYLANEKQKLLRPLLESLDNDYISAAFPNANFKPFGEPISGDPLREWAGFDPMNPQAMLGEIASPMATIAKILGITVKSAIAGAKLVAGTGFDPSLAMTLFHGTPHKFEKFSLDKIGTGEGAQAFGHGLYFAESKGVARSYQADVTFQKSFDGGASLVENGKDIPQSVVKDRVTKRLSGSGASSEQVSQIADDIIQGIDPNAVTPNNVSAAQSGNLPAKYQKWYGDALDETKGITTQQGSLYEVEIPDNITNKMLDWDKPLSEQPESVRKALQGVLKDPEPVTVAGGSVRVGLRRRNTLEEATAAYRKRLEGEKGGDIYMQLRQQLGGQEAASKALSEAGIPGIRYKSGQLSGGKGDTSNIVVFNPDDITSVKRDGVLVHESKLGISEGGFLGGSPIEGGIGALSRSKADTALKAIKNAAADKGIKLDIFEKDGVIDLSRIVVPEKGQGVGSEIMRQIIDYADQTGQTIKLTPTKDFGASSVGRLKKFYKQFGFIENKGRNKTFEFRDSMYRLPKNEIDEGIGAAIDALTK